MIKSKTVKTLDSAKREGYKYTTLGWIPEDWNLTKIKDIAKLSSGLISVISNLSSGFTSVMSKSNSS